MQSYNYNDPVKYEPPPRTPRTIPKWLIILVCVVCILGLLGFMGLMSLRNALENSMTKDLPPAGVRVGSAFQWRTLEKRTAFLPGQSGAMGGLVAADFDADGDEEILLISPMGQSEVMEIDGTKRQVKIGGMRFMMGAIPWDYDRDGIAEIVAETMLGDVFSGALRGNTSADNITMSQTLPVYDLDGNVVATLDAVGSTPGSIMTADLDGNGFLELLAPPPSKKSKFGGESLVAFGKNGMRVWKTKESVNGIFTSTGDVDGDGMDEILFLTNRLTNIEAIGHKQEPLVLAGFANDIPQGDFVGNFDCIDLNADGIDEIIFPEQGILDPSTQTFSKLKWPTSDHMMLRKSHRIDLNSDGTLEVAIAGMMGSAVYIFDSSGICKYHEEFGESVMGATSVNANGEDYLVIQFSEKLLIYP